jgi:hypothetical protein
LGDALVGDLSGNEIADKKALKRKIKEIAQAQDIGVSKISSPRLSPIRSSIDASRTPHVRSRTPRLRLRDDSDIKRPSREHQGLAYLDLAMPSESRSSGNRHASSSHSSPRSTPGSSSSSILSSRLVRSYDFSQQVNRDLAVKGLRSPSMHKMAQLLEITKKSMLNDVTMDDFLGSIIRIYFDPDMASNERFEQEIMEARKKIEEFDKGSRSPSPLRSPLASPDFSSFVSPESSPRVDLISSSPEMSPLTSLSSPGNRAIDDEYFSLSRSASSSSSSSSSSGAEKRLDDYFTFNQDAFKRMMESK